MVYTVNARAEVLITKPGEMSEVLPVGTTITGLTGCRPTKTTTSTARKPSSATATRTARELRGLNAPTNAMNNANNATGRSMRPKTKRVRQEREEKQAFHNQTENKADELASMFSNWKVHGGDETPILKTGGKRKTKK